MELISSTPCELAVTKCDMFYVTGLLKYSILYCKNIQEMLIFTVQFFCQAVQLK